MKSLLGLLGIFILASSSPAAVLVSYTFSGTTTGNLYDPTSTNTELNPSNIDINASATSISQVGNLAWRFQSGTTNMSIYPGNTATNSSTSVGTAITTGSDAVAQGSYFKFTLTATSGYQINLTNLTFDASKGGSGSRGFVIQTSASGFSTDGSTNLSVSGSTSGTIVSGTFTALSTVGTGTNYTPITLDLSGTSYQHLASFEVRIYSYSGSTASSLEYDNFIVNGLVSVPEPATWALAAGAGTAFMVIRRRRRS